MNVRLSISRSGVCYLRIEQGKRSLEFSYGKRLKKVVCDARTQEDQALYYTEQLLQYMDRGEPVSLMGCLELIAKDCESIEEFIKELKEVTA